MQSALDYVTLIRQYVPDFTVMSARLLEAGQFNHVLCVDDQWIFRFPKSDYVAQEVGREVNLLQRLQGKLPLPIPNPTYIAYHPDTHQLEFMGYAMLEGEPLWRDKFATLTDESILDQLAEEIATFLKVLHSIPPEAIELTETPPDSRQSWQNYFDAFKTQLFPHMRSDAQADVTHNFEQALADDDLWDFTPHLIHGDFGTGNILYADGHIVGVIDFAFCAVDDPAQDVGALLSSYGETFIERVFAYYPDLRPALRRANFYRSNYALLEAYYGLRDNNPADFESGIKDYR